MPSGSLQTFPDTLELLHRIGVHCQGCRPESRVRPWNGPCYTWTAVHAARKLVSLTGVSRHGFVLMQHLPKAMASLAAHLGQRPTQDLLECFCRLGKGLGWSSLLTLLVSPRTFLLLA